jgi:heme exporter protein D
MLKLDKASEEVYNGDVLRAQVNLLEVGVVDKKVDVVANYFIKDFEGEVFMKGSETFFVLAEKDYVKEFDVRDLPEGKYVLGLEVEYPNAFASASSQFAVQGKYVDNIYVKLALIVSTLVIIVLIFRMFSKRRKHKV